MLGHRNFDTPVARFLHVQPPSASASLLKDVEHAIARNLFNPFVSAVAVYMAALPEVAQQRALDNLLLKVCGQCFSFPYFRKTPDMALHLIGAGASVNCYGSEGETPSMNTFNVVAYGHEGNNAQRPPTSRLLKILFEHGASAEITNNREENMTVSEFDLYNVLIALEGKRRGVREELEKEEDRLGQYELILYRNVQAWVPSLRPGVQKHLLESLPELDTPEMAASFARRTPWMLVETASSRLALRWVHGAVVRALCERKDAVKTFPHSADVMRVKDTTADVAYLKQKWATVQQLYSFFCELPTRQPWVKLQDVPVVATGVLHDLGAVLGADTLFQSVVLSAHQSGVKIDPRHPGFDALCQLLVGLLPAVVAVWRAADLAGALPSIPPALGKDGPRVRMRL